jgi:hypothetical protein
MNAILAESTGQPVERIARITDRNFWMNAVESVEYVWWTIYWTRGSEMPRRNAVPSATGFRGVKPAHPGSRGVHLRRLRSLLQRNHLRNPRQGEEKASKGFLSKGLPSPREIKEQLTSTWLARRGQEGSIRGGLQPLQEAAGQTPGAKPKWS